MSGNTENPLRLTRFVQRFCDAIPNSAWPEIEAFGIGGSFAKNQADDSSDLDFFILVGDKELHAFLSRAAAFVAMFGEPMLYRPPRFLEEHGYSFSAIYEPLLRCQFTVNERTSLTPGPGRKKTRILYDRTGYYSDFTRGQVDIVTDCTKLFESSSALFWFRVVNVWEDLRRDQLWFAVRHLNDIRHQLFILARLLSGEEIASAYDIDKNIEHDLGVGLCYLLRQSVATYDKSSIRQAMCFCINWYEANSVRYAARTGVALANPTPAAAARIAALIRSGD